MSGVAVGEVRHNIHSGTHGSDPHLVVKVDQKSEKVVAVAYMRSPVRLSRWKSEVFCSNFAPLTDVPRFDLLPYSQGVCPYCGSGSGEPLPQAVAGCLCPKIPLGDGRERVLHINLYHHECELNRVLPGYGASA